MNDQPIPAAEDPRISRIRASLVDLLPAHAYQMHRLATCFDISLDTRIPTACVDCDEVPRMRFNPDFIEEHCTTPGDLFLLVMHELYHVILGHTRLFPRSDLASNIAFDAVINAMLCHNFHDTAGTNLFTSTNGWEHPLGRLLRPPPGWPDAPEDRALEGLADDERLLMHLLYYDDSKYIAYHDLFAHVLALLRDSGGVWGMRIDGIGGSSGRVADGLGPPILLGTHGSDATPDADSDILDQAIADFAGSWINWKPDGRNGRSAYESGGRSESLGIHAYTPRPTPRTGRYFRAAIEALLRKCGVNLDNTTTVAPGIHLKRMPAEQVHESVLPAFRDRRMHAWRMATGNLPILFRHVDATPRPRPDPKQRTHVYLDISGSMTATVSFLERILDAPLRRGEVRLFVFSTVVDEVKTRRIAKATVANTYGTDINAVLAHLRKIPAKKRPRQALVLTDGLVGRPLNKHLDALKGTKLTLGCCSNQWRRSELESWSTLHQLPNPTK